MIQLLEEVFEQAETILIHQCLSYFYGQSDLFGDILCPMIVNRPALYQFSIDCIIQGALVITLI